MARFLSFLFFLLVARAAWQAVSRWLDEGETPPARDDHAKPVYKGVMVRDPVCGLHLPEDRAITLVHDGERIHFCSEQCRRAFRLAS